MYSIAKKLKSDTSSKEVSVFFYPKVIFAEININLAGKTIISDDVKEKNENTVFELEEENALISKTVNGFRTKDYDENGNAYPPTKKELELYKYIDNLLWNTNLEEKVIFERAGQKYDISPKRAQDIYKRIMIKGL